MGGWMLDSGGWWMLERDGVVGESQSQSAREKRKRRGRERKESKNKVLCDMCADMVGQVGLPADVHRITTDDHPPHAELLVLPWIYRVLSASQTFFGSVIFFFLCFISLHVREIGYEIRLGSGERAFSLHLSLRGCVGSRPI